MSMETITMHPAFCSSPTPPSPRPNAPSTNGEIVDGAEEAPRRPVDSMPVHVFISPIAIVHVAGDGRAAAPVLPPAYTGVLYLQQQRHELPLMMVTTGQQQRADEHKKKREKWFKEMRGWLIVVAVLVASVTYQAGLSPPGGFWQDSGDGHTAGAPVLESTFPRRHAAFFYCNATAFMMSLAIIGLLMDESIYHHSESKVVGLKAILILDMAMLMGAYLAGSSRTPITTMFTFVLGMVVFVSIYIVYTKQFLLKLLRAGNSVLCGNGP